MSKVKRFSEGSTAKTCFELYHPTREWSSEKRKRTQRTTCGITALYTERAPHGTETLNSAINDEWICDEG